MHVTAFFSHVTKRVLGFVVICVVQSLQSPLSQAAFLFTIPFSSYFHRHAAHLQDLHSLNYHGCIYVFFLGLLRMHVSWQSHSTSLRCIWLESLLIDTLKGIVYIPSFIPLSSYSGFVVWAFAFLGITHFLSLLDGRKAPKDYEQRPMIEHTCEVDDLCCTSSKINS